MPASATQLALPVHLRDDATLENFLFTDALGALEQHLQQLSAESALYLHGGAGTGRSHLLQAACHAVSDGEALYLPLEQLGELDPAEVLAGLESLSLICLDNLDAVAGKPDWEEALFHLINRCREQGCRLVFSAAAAPRQLAVQLADLRSRLSWGMVFQLPDVTDADKLLILQFRARQRGMTLGDETAAYIMSRASRSLAELIDVLEQLDRDSMVAQRPLTIPFVKQSLGW
ncbi:MAG: DnaA regulatory inactivator Hda [Halieaceae bacterium]